MPISTRVSINTSLYDDSRYLQFQLELFEGKLKEIEDIFIEGMKLDNLDEEVKMIMLNHKKRVIKATIVRLITYYQDLLKITKLPKRRRRKQKP